MIFYYFFFLTACSNQYPYIQDQSHPNNSYNKGNYKPSEDPVVLGSMAPLQTVINEKTKQCGTFTGGDANTQTCSLPKEWVYGRCSYHITVINEKRKECADTVSFINEKKKECGKFYVGDDDPKPSLPKTLLADGWLYGKCPSSYKNISVISDNKTFTCPSGYKNIGQVKGVNCKKGLWFQ